jgi:hypothetical protein
MVTRDEAYDYRNWLPVAFTWKGYTVYEFPEANVKGYGPTAVAYGASVADELRTMRGRGFDPQRAAVVSLGERPSFADGRALSPLRASEITIERQTLIFTATSEGRALAVLPFRYSSCWKTEWRGTPGRVLRVDTALIGVLFDGSTEVRLTWGAGYGPAARCLHEDAKLVAQTKAAAKSFR